MANILIYPVCKEGYVHTNIPKSVNTLMTLLDGHKVDISWFSTIFDTDISHYDLIIFPNTNNDVFDNDGQRERFKQYVQSGKGVLGIHSFVGTERKWEWFKRMKGCSFLWHAKIQTIRNIVVQPEHPSMVNVPRYWDIEDECYFGEDYFDGVEVLMVHNLSSLDKDESDLIKHYAGRYNILYPSTWYNNYDGGHVWVTSLGHNEETYDDPKFQEHIKGGVEFLLNKVNGSK